MSGSAWSEQVKIRKLCAAIIALAAWTLMFPGYARAQTRLELWPLLNLTADYTDNVLFSPSNPKSDEFGTASGGFDLDLINPDRRLELTYTTDAQAYVNHTQFNRTPFDDHYVGLTDYERLSASTNLSLSDTFIKGQPVFGQGLIGAQGVSPLLSQTLLQQEFLTNAFSASLHHTFDARNSIDVEGHQTFYDTSTGVTTISNNQGGHVTAYHALNEKLRILFGYEFEDYRFSGLPRSESHQPYVGFVYEPIANLSLTAQSGPLIIESPFGNSVDFGYSATATYLMKRLQLTLTSSRAPSLTAGFGSAAITESVAGTAQYALNKLTSVFANSGYWVANGGGINEKILTWSVGVNRVLTPGFSVFVQYLGFQTTTPLGPGSVLTNTALIGASFKTATPFRMLF